MVKDLWARIQMGTSSDPVINSLGELQTHSAVLLKSSSVKWSFY